MDKIWVVRGAHIGEDGVWNVGYFKSEEAAFKKRDECKKEAEEDDFDNYFTVQGPYHVE